MRPIRLALGGLLVLPFTALAGPPPSVNQMLELKPTQRFVDYDTPAAEVMPTLKAEVVTEGKATGWVLRDPSGRPYRKFMDTNRDNVVDQWRYYHDGAEVYRDTDTNFNGRADEFRWMNFGGSRWGIDRNEDGKIDGYRVLSAEEATREVVRALILKDFSILQSTLAGPGDAQSLGSIATGNELKDLNVAARDQFTALISKLSEITSESRWVRFEGNIPITVPGDAPDGSRDVQVYRNATVIIQTGEQADALQFGEIALVGKVWKILAVPTVAALNPTPIARANSVFTNVAPAVEIPDTDTAADKDLQAIIGQLQKLDEEASKNGTSETATAQYHLQRAGLLQKLAELSKTDQERVDWQRQQADSLIAALQVTNSREAVDRLNKMVASVQQAKDESGLSAYITFRKISADYSRKMQAPDTDFAAAQIVWLEELEKFVTAYPNAEDSAEALSQLAVGMEYTGKEDQAREYYKKLTGTFPKSPSAQRGIGSLRRLDGVGKSFSLKGSELRRGALDIQRYQGKVVLVEYWASTCDPWKADLPRLKELYAKYRSKGFEIIGVSLDGDKADAAKIVQSLGISWPVIFEAGGLDSPLAIEYGILALPTQFLVDAQGKVVSRTVHVAQLEEELKKLLK